MYGHEHTWQIQKSTVGHLDLSIGVYEQVFRLEIAVENVEEVDIFKGKDDLASVETSVWFREAAEATEMGEHFSTADKVREHVQVRVVLEDEAETDDRRESEGSGLLLRCVLPVIKGRKAIKQG